MLCMKEDKASWKLLVSSEFRVQVWDLVKSWQRASLKVKGASVTKRLEAAGSSPGIGRFKNSDMILGLILLTKSVLQDNFRNLQARLNIFRAVEKN